MQSSTDIAANAVNPFLRAGRQAKISPNYLDTPDDRKITADAIRVTRRLVRRPVLSAYTPTVLSCRGGRILKPNGCDIAFDDDNGMWALKSLEAFGRAGMPNLALGQAHQSFVAGRPSPSATRPAMVPMWRAQRA